MQSYPWCPTCGTQHASENDCPPRLVPDGPEDEVWRVSVETPRGVQGHGVLVAAVGRAWRARIMTFPNVMWTVPGGGSSIKFFGHSPEDAERQAVAFVRLHCGRLGHVLRDELEPVATSVSAPRPVRLHLPRAAPSADEGAVVVPPRFDRELPVHYGVNRPSVEGTTANLSERGLFVTTRRPLPQGALAGLLLEMEHCKVPLRGAVVWNRVIPDLGREAGMGLELLRPPTIYVRYVRALDAQ